LSFAFDNAANQTRREQSRLVREQSNCFQKRVCLLTARLLKFEPTPKWSNPLMGWTSTRDPLSQVKLQFSSEEQAVEYAKRQGIRSP
jgi:NADH dehydrogenase (ubiquinone) Fe-S protein 4